MARKPLKSETLLFTSLAPKGEASADGVHAFAVAPGETARCLVGKRRKGARQAWVQEVLEPSPHRVEPRCPHFGTCGGCVFQHLAYEHQLSLKAGRLYQALGAAFPEAELLPACPAPSPWHYRSKVELSFQNTPPRLGFNRRGRFDWLVDVEECFIGPPGNKQVLAATREWAAPLTGWDPRRHTGMLRYLVLRYAFATAQWLAVLVSSPGEVPAEALAARLMGLGATGVLHVRQSSIAGAIKPDEEKLLAGGAVIEERLFDLRFALSWRSFFQSNPPAFERMLEEARAWSPLAPGERLLDLFCGIGTVGLALCPPEADLVGVESVGPAVEDARRNAVLNGRSGEFHCMPSEEWPDLGCDLLVLDPPRSGCHPKLVERVAREGPSRVLYISCNPGRFLDEMEVLGSAYRLVRVRAYDFFPNTRHLEALCLLERG